MPDAISTLVTPQYLQVFLQRALPWLERTISEYHTHYWSLDTLVACIMKGEMQLWAAEKDGKYLFVVTEWSVDLTGKALHVVLGGGELDSEKAIVDQVSIIEKYCQNMGGVGVVIWGRLGWRKLLARHGYQLESAVFRHSFTERMN